MPSAAKKRASRRRPVLAARVPEALYATVEASARESGRNLSEELIWRAEQSYLWEAAFKSRDRILSEANRIAGETLKARLEAELRRQGYTRVRAMEGAAWFEPGVSSIRWIFANVDAESRTVLQEMLDLAATRALEKSKET